ncbi:MAG: hypothetical protein CFE21_06225 [Bacteroidetes bacterium B1(2017)]|nr:MAG: hypothetical protein CFE21_06225 [Bacteroidetes bacterium B1(2017)]
MKNILLLFATSILLLVSACAPSTVVTGSWKKPEVETFKGKYKHIFVAGILSDIAVRTKLETAIANRATARGMEATISSDVFPPNFTKKDLPEKDKLIEIISNTKSDVILTVAVKSIKEETRYVQTQSTPMYAPYPRYGYYGGFYGYYGQTYQEGYYTTDEIVFLETNIYDAKTLELQWSGQTKTTNAGNVDTFIKEYLYAILDRLQKEGLISGNPKK